MQETIFPRSVGFGDVLIREGQRLLLITLRIDDSKVSQFGTRDEEGNLVVEVAIPFPRWAGEVAKALDEAGVPA